MELWYVVFDIIYDERPIMHLPLSERQQHLQRAIRPDSTPGEACCMLPTHQDLLPSSLGVLGA